MAEIVPPTTRPLPPDPPLVRTLHDRGDTRAVIIGASSGGGGFVGKRENPPLPRGVP